MPYSPQTWTNGVSKLNATRMGVIETGIQTAQAAAEAAIAKSLVDAKGDLIVGTAADTAARLAVGTNNFALVADSAQTGGVKWAQITNAMVDAAAAIAVSKLAAGSAGQILKTVGSTPTWTAAATVGYGTSLPGSPADGDEYVLVDSTTAPTYTWRFRYNAGSASSYKWEFVGGSPKVVKVAASESSSSTSYVDLTTDGPSFTLPNAGDYDFLWTVHIPFLTNVATMYGSLFVNGVQVEEAQTLNAIAGPGSSTSITGQFRHTGAAASHVAKVRYKTSAATATWQNRTLRVVPVRVS